MQAKQETHSLIFPAARRPARAKPAPSRHVLNFVHTAKQNLIFLRHAGKTLHLCYFRPRTKKCVCNNFIGRFCLKYLKMTKLVFKLQITKKNVQCWTKFEQLEPRFEYKQTKRILPQK